MDFELKKLHPNAIPAALERAERYRLLNEPAQAESICQDILRTDAANQEAIILLLLALTDQFSDSITANVARAAGLLHRLNDEYQRHYYRGILHERQAHAILHRGNPGAGCAAYEKFREAMTCYEKAEHMRPPENDEALLRWNTCARTIMFARLEPSPQDESTLMLE
jgi:tetratricopeptide (TPR) repeat protein